MRLKPNEMIGIYRNGKFLYKVKHVSEAKRITGTEESVYNLIASGGQSKKGYTFDIVEAE